MGVFGVRGEVATGGRGHLERANEYRTYSPIIDPFTEFSGCGGWETEKSSDSSNRMKSREDRWRYGRRK